MSSPFHDLHAPDRLLVLANAWDAGSARLVEDCGAPAIATTSAGLAWARGYPDGDALPVAVLAAAIAEITRVVRIPVSADVEGGYAADAAGAGETVARVLDAGAVGINLEDGTESPDVLCAKIEAARRAAARAGVPLFVNARIDTYLRALVPPERALAETVQRAARYRAAGCDGIFVPRAKTHDDVHAMVAAIAPLPLNLLAVPGLPPAAELRTWGVRRLSAGSAIAAAALGITRNLTSTFLEHGRSDDLFNDPIEYGRMNALLSARAAVP
jgi:2-methylisocitrate lyase-like PEP mutase family enzyme